MQAFGRHPVNEKPHIKLRRGVWLVVMCADWRLNRQALTWVEERNGSL